MSLAGLAGTDAVASLSTAGFCLAAQDANVPTIMGETAAIQIIR
jgi:hypothetical protein